MDVSLAKFRQLLTYVLVDDVVCGILALSKHHEASLVVLRALEALGLDSADEVLEVGELLDLEDLLDVSLADNEELQGRRAIFRDSDGNLHDDLVLLGPDHFEGTGAEEALPLFELDLEQSVHAVLSS